MNYSKGNKMIPDWLLQILLLIIGVIASGAVWYYLSQNKYHHALWSGAAAMMLLILVVAFYIHNEIVKREIQAKTPVYFGELVPSNDPFPPLPKGASKDTITLMLGDNLRVLAAKSENHLGFWKDGVSFLSISIKDNDVMRLSASIVDSDNKNIVKIIDNEFQANPEWAFNPKQPDKHSLVVHDSKGVEVLNVKFINPRAMRIVGRFHIPGIMGPIQILPKEGVLFPEGGGFSNMELDFRSGEAGGLGVKGYSGFLVGNWGDQMDVNKIVKKSKLTVPTAKLVN